MRYHAASAATSGPRSHHHRYQKQPASPKSAFVLAGSLALVATVLYLTCTYTSMGAGVYKSLSKSGFTAAFALIFVSELGDKTFFIAALLAMRLGRFTVLAGATSALCLMSVISVVIGRLCQKIPSSINDTLPIGEYLAVGLLFYFGSRTLMEAITRQYASPIPLTDGTGHVTTSKNGTGNAVNAQSAGVWAGDTRIVIGDVIEGTKDGNRWIGGTIGCNFQVRVSH